MSTKKILIYGGLVLLGAVLSKKSATVSSIAETIAKPLPTLP